MLKRALFFTSCFELPLDRFIKVLTQNDYKALLKRRLPLVPERLIKTVWDEIFYEYVDLNGDVSYKKMFALTKAIIKAETENLVIQEIARILRYKYHPDLVKLFKSLGFERFKFDPADREGFANDLNRALSLQKNRLFDLARLKNDLEELKGTNKKAKKIEAADYLSVLNELGKFQGYRIDAKTVSVAEFIAALNSYKKHLNEAKKRAKNGKN